ncbi:hypothetical protein CC79DRAFT_1338120 [Sarocladium strictum]
MSSSNQPAVPSDSEHAPLLSGQDPESHGTVPRHSTNDDESHDDEPAGDILTRTSRTWILVLLVVTLVFSLAFSGLSIAAFFMLYYGENRYGVSDYQINAALVFWIVVTGVVGITHSTINIIRIRRNGLTKLPHLRLLLIISACLTLAASVGLAPYYIDLDSWYCSQDGLDGPWYPGTWEQCQDWEFAYKMVCWNLVVDLFLNSIFSFILLITAFSIGRSRNPVEANPSWTISPGYFTFEFKIHWGGANPDQQRQEQSVERNGDVESPEQVTTGQQ